MVSLESGHHTAYPIIPLRCKLDSTPPPVAQSTRDCRAASLALVPVERESYYSSRDCLVIQHEFMKVSLGLCGFLL